MGLSTFLIKNLYLEILNLNREKGMTKKPKYNIMSEYEGFCSTWRVLKQL